MENLSDLRKDDNFHEAVTNAEKCGSYHRKTLIYLKEEFTEKNSGCIVQANYKNTEHCDFKPECEKCHYAGNGFVCHNETNGTCLKNWLNKTKTEEQTICQNLNTKKQKTSRSCQTAISKINA